MSLAACAKLLLCDENVSKAQAVANCYDFLDEQSKAQYSNDPIEILDLKEKLSKIINPKIGEGIKEAVSQI